MLSSALAGCPQARPRAAGEQRGSPGPACDLHQRLAALARAQAPLRRALARLAGRLVAARGFERLGFVRLGDYAVERLGRSARSLQDLARVDAALGELPGVEAAFLRGEISWTQARLLARAATPADEARWLALARERSARALEREVRRVDLGSLEAGAPRTDEDGAPEEEREGVRIRCTPAVRAKLFRARQLARRVAGEALPVWACMEAVAAEVASAIPVEPWTEEGVDLVQPEAAGRGGPLRPRLGSAMARLTGLSPRGAANVCAPHAPGSDQPGGGGEARAANVCAPHAPESDQPGGGGDLLAPDFLRSLVEDLEELDAFALDARLRRAVALEQQLEARLGPLLLAVAEARRYREQGFPSLETYARERLGLSPRKARALLRLERASRRAPALREAYRSGRLSWVKAQTLVPVALAAEAPLEAWVRWAERVTVRRLEEDVERGLVAHEFDPGAAFPEPPARAVAGPAPAPHRREETARPFFTAPRPVARFFRAVLCSVRRRIERVTGRLPTEGEGLEAMLDHALESWGHPEAKLRREHRVFERDGWRCTVPGCSSYRNLHEHHIVFRSAGGSEALANRTTLCAAHHQRGVHGGRLRCTGQAPGRLRFELGVRAGRPPLAVYRSGDLCVSRQTEVLSLGAARRQSPSLHPAGGG